MEQSLLDEWPCYRKGHKFKLRDFSLAYQKRVFGKKEELKCSRCARKIKFDEINNTAVNVARFQNSLISNSLCTICFNSSRND
jgi:hypothetical protein